jgi:MOSC domain-containing protein YiiM
MSSQVPDTGRVVSVNVGLATQVPYRGGMVSTAIFKRPVEGRVMLRATNLDGDGQADPSVHGGAEMAAYVYSWDSYRWWMEELGHELQPGEFGENLTVTGFTDEDVQVGDVIRVGAARTQVTTPREPCFKLGIRMGDHRFPARFREANRMGFYLRVLEEGEISAGDAVELEERAGGSLTIAEFHDTYTSRRDDPAALRRMLEAPRLAESWRTWVEKRLAEAT